MKKILLLVLVLSGYTIAHSQEIVFQENWDGLGLGISGWTFYNQDGLNPAEEVSYITNAWVAANEEFDNKVARSTSRYNPVGQANDWLVSPAIELPGGTGALELTWEAISYHRGPSGGETYKVLISQNGNAIDAFTTVLEDIEAPIGEDDRWRRRSVEIPESYKGRTIHIAFQNHSRDRYLMGIDNINIINYLPGSGGTSCSPPGRVMGTTAVTATTATVEWPTIGTGLSGGYDVAIGAPGFTPTTPVNGSPIIFNTYTFTDLTPNNRYHFYVRHRCGSMWIGPYSIFTAVSLPYSYSFETTTANGGYGIDGWLGNFALKNSYPAVDGVQTVSSTTSTTGTVDKTLISKPILLEADEIVTLRFFTRAVSAGPGETQTLGAFVGTRRSTSSDHWKT